ncbi:hypothetical protein OMO38_10340 [Chryseobacterium sp. 09-1422]|uniref:Immunity protein 63 domain-containing protein n=1 Tax=Chryseobacterium kimseyorum TaxID=2984028 RepID=A0ABT3HYZ9_9FLAO|nr:hypothetical protein [Chryseobacterium kimseyorum]MCW3168920.1 hypothetical protein [Chryseobacterium kimseyorum]
MTPRKELFIKIKQALTTIPELELVDLERQQMQSNQFPDLFVSALIRINKITYQSMTEQKQEGEANIDVILYCRDGWMNQHNGTEDFEHGLNEIDLLDSIAEKMQFLTGDQFTALEQVEDETEEQSMSGMFSYRQSFSTNIYRKLNPKYSPQKISI